MGIPKFTKSCALDLLFLVFVLWRRERREVFGNKNNHRHFSLFRTHALLPLPFTRFSSSSPPHPSPSPLLLQQQQLRRPSFFNTWFSVRASIHSCVHSASRIPNKLSIIIPSFFLNNKKEEVNYKKKERILLCFIFCF